MTNKERSKAIRETLKKAGYKTSDFSIRSYDCGYSDSSKIHIKNLSIDVSKIRNLLKKFESVDYDERSGEILSGGNTYIIVDYDYETIRAKENEVRQELDDLIEKLDNSKIDGYVSYIIGDLRVFSRDNEWSAYEDYDFAGSSLTRELFRSVPKEQVSCRLLRSYVFAKLQDKSAA